MKTIITQHFLSWKIPWFDDIKESMKLFVSKQSTMQHFEWHFIFKYLFVFRLIVLYCEYVTNNYSIF